YLNENNFINDAKINEYKLLDNKIINHQFISSASGLFEIDLSKVDTDKCSRDNCIISYIAFAGFGKQKQIVANSVYLDKDYKYSDPRIVQEYVRQNCDLKTQCKFPVSFENFGTATNIDKTFSEEPKLLVRYIYSYATQKIKQENLVKRLYNKIANDTNYKRILNLSIVLMFTFYGFGYLIGVSELKQSEIIDRVIKIGIIYLFTNPDFGWIWFEKFFVDGFKNGADFLTFTMASIFDDSGSIENSIKNGVFIDKSPLFSSADNIINLFISNDAIHKKIGALLFYKLFGIIYLFIIYHSIFNYIYAISNAVLIYLTAQVFTSILFMVGPIFFIFILFKQTRSFFDNWINAIIGFALQQIFLIFTLTLFNVLIYNFVKLALSYRVCWDTVWKIDTFTGSIPLLRFWTVQDAPSFLSDIQNINYSGDNNNTNPSLTPILSIWSLTLIMKSFINSITDLASTLAGGIDASSLGNGIKDSMNGMLKETASKINKIYEKSGAQKAVQKLDQSLFNSGQLAKNERLMRKRANVNNKRLANKMVSAGDKAVKDYKINNAQEFKNIKDPQEQKKKLQEIKAEAMKNEAKKAGKNDEQIKSLMKDQKNDGSKILNAIRSNLKNNDNIFQGIARAIDDIRNPIYSLDNKSKEVDPKMNKDEIKMAIKKIDRPEERDEFEQLDNELSIRKKLVSLVNEKAKYYGLDKRIQMSIGGQISIDIFPCHRNNTINSVPYSKCITILY
ncbi:MAG: hypothetical protein EBS92_06905, partial [Proteobacteria bacterium]|nr:hypothetical protein [Pseudomonadota bacterium]